nr:M20/M25/M40 family metallo-hydrolase [Salsipaludibacter albus]
MEEAVTAHCRGVAAAHGLEVEVDFQRLYPVTTNDRDAVEMARSVVDRLAPGRWHDLADPVTGSEDFSRVLQAVPGAMLFLGACLPDRDPTTAPDNHSPDAAYDDGVLLDGAHLLAELATTSLAP